MYIISRPLSWYLRAYNHGKAYWTRHKCEAFQFGVRANAYRAAAGLNAHVELR
jgi:hypothetical protein